MSQNHVFFNGPRFFHSFREQLERSGLKPSALGVYILLHYECDEDGYFCKDQAEFARSHGLQRMTVWNGFTQLERKKLIEPVGDGYRIVGYSRLFQLAGKGEGSYFYLPLEFKKTIALCIRHHVTDVLLFALKLLDMFRHDGSKPTFRKSTLKDQLGYFICRVKNKLKLLSDIITFEVVKGAKEDNYIFSPVIEVLAKEEEIQYRNTNGTIYRGIRAGLNVSGVKTFSSLNYCVRLIRKRVLGMKLEDVYTKATVVGIKIGSKLVDSEKIYSIPAFINATLDELLQT